MASPDQGTGPHAEIIHNVVVRGRRSPITILFGLVAVLAVVATSCAAPATTTKADPLVGRYRVSAGGGTIPVIQNLTKRFSELHPGALWDIENIGSDAAIGTVADGSADLGGVSREMSAPDKQKVAALQIGLTGTAVAVSAANPIASLTKEQIRSIFAGEIRDWKDVGSPAGAITVFVREPTAATRQVFDEFVFGGTAAYRSDYTPVDSNDQTLNALTSFKGAIAMVTLTAATQANTKIRLVPIGGVAATSENLASGAYPMRRPLYVVYRNDPAKLKPAIAALVEFTKSAEGQQIVSGK